MARRVALVYDRNFGDRLEKLSMTMPVWIVESEANRAAAERAWHAALEWPQISVTIFRSPDDPQSAESWRFMIRQLELHHGPLSARQPFSVIEVIGIPLTDAAHESLHDAGFTRVEETAAGFRATALRR